MKMLECIAMLDYLLSSLEAGKRIQVPASKYNEVKSVLIPLYKKVATFSNEQTQLALEALLEAVNVIDICAMQYLTDFEPSESVTPLMREVVTVAAMKGVI